MIIIILTITRFIKSLVNRDNEQMNFEWNIEAFSKQLYLNSKRNFHIIIRDFFIAVYILEIENNSILS